MNQRKIFSAIGALLLLAAAARAQCFGDDGFNIPGVPCCVPTQPNLPAFPAISMQARGCCFRSCGIEQTFGVNIFMNNPIPVFCDVFAIPISISGTVNTANTFIVAKYHRTWLETNAAGVVGRQVWRFLVNGDLTYQLVAGGPAPPCPVPTCAAAGLPVHFTGSVDYALDCATGAFDAAINLTHMCGTYSHGPLSLRPTPAGFEHRERSYAIVGPAPFDFNIAPVPDGGFSADMQRSTQANISVFPPVWQCYTESQVIMGGLTTVQQRCPCPDPAVPASPRWSDQVLGFDYICNTVNPPFQFNSLAFGNVLPTGLTGMSLGRYVGPAGSYPSGEAISVYIGIAVSPDPCGFNIPVHIVTGVGTFGGDASMLFPTPQFPNGQFVREFLDLENVLAVQSSSPPQLTIGFGVPFLSTMNWGLNPM